MLLPENLQHFPEPTLILIGDFGKTLFYKAQDIEINEIRTIEANEPAHPDSDASSAIGNGRMTNTDSKIDEGEDRKSYTKQVAKEITDVVDDYDIKKIQIIMPAELIRRIKNELSKDVSELITRTLDKNLIKTDLLEALERLHEVPEPIKE